MSIPIIMMELVKQKIPEKFIQVNSTRKISDTKRENKSRMQESRHPRTLRKIYSVSLFCYEIIRKATFDSWPLDFIDGDEMAKAGFVYTKKADQVYCVYCKGVVGYWEREDVPFEEHKKHFPTCPFVEGKVMSDIPDTRDDLYAFLNRYLNMALNQSVNILASKCILEQDSKKEADTIQAYPQHADYNRRMLTFFQWPKCNVPQPTDLAKAGFFYTGIADYVICYACGGGIFNWARDDDPLEDHRKLYSHCYLVKSRIDERDDLPFRFSSLLPHEQKLLMAYPLAQKIKSMGVSERIIIGALKDYVEKSSHLPRTFSECFEVISEWEENNKSCITLQEVPHDAQYCGDSGSQNKKYLTHDQDLWSICAIIIPSNLTICRRLVVLLQFFPVQVKKIMHGINQSDSVPFGVYRIHSAPSCTW